MLVVQKFGGSSLASCEHIKNVAKIVSDEKKNGNDVIVVVSAMGGVTNKIISLCREISEINSKDKLREYDNAISTGEVVSSSLLSIALIDLGYNAKSFSSWQIPIISDNNYSNANIIDIQKNNITDFMSKGGIPIITGFQAISKDHNIATLGRGGSDTTAVSIAAYLSADLCDIYTDVEGVFSADPRLVENPYIIEEVTYDEMIEFSKYGAKVMHSKSIDTAKKYNINIRIVSTFTLTAGTIITKHGSNKRSILGVSLLKNLVKLKINKITNTQLLDLLESYQILKFENINYEEFLFEDYILDLIKSHSYNNIFQIEENISAVTMIIRDFENIHEISQKVTNILLENNLVFKEIHILNRNITIITNNQNGEKIIKKLHSNLIENSY